MRKTRHRDKSERLGRLESAGAVVVYYSPQHSRPDGLIPGQLIPRIRPVASVSPQRRLAEKQTASCRHRAVPENGAGKLHAPAQDVLPPTKNCSNLCHN